MQIYGACGIVAPVENHHRGRSHGFNDPQIQQERDLNNLSKQAAAKFVGVMSALPDVLLAIEANKHMHKLLHTCVTKFNLCAKL